MPSILLIIKDLVGQNLAGFQQVLNAIDNKIEHKGYCPSKIDCINGIKAMEELIAELRNMDIKLAEDIRNKIYEDL